MFVLALPVVTFAGKCLIGSVCGCVCQCVDVWVCAFLLALLVATFARKCLIDSVCGCVCKRVCMSGSVCVFLCVCGGFACSHLRRQVSH